jgi:putative ABC transport system permease protein
MFIKTAVKNVFRHKRRTILNIIAIVLNVTGIIFLTAFYRGGIVDRYEMTINYLTAHIQIHHPGYEEKERGLPLDFVVENSDQLIEYIKKNEKVEGVSKRIDFGLTLSNGEEQISCLGIGIQPEEEEHVGVLKEVIIEGDYLEKGDEGVLIGHRLAALLDLKVGDTIIAFFTTAYNQPNLMYTEVKGIFNYKFSLLDKSAVYFSYDLIKEFLNMPGDPTKIMIKMKNEGDVGTMMDYLSCYQSHYSIKSWEYFARALIEDTKGDIAFMSLLFLILIIIAIFGIVNTMTTSVMERTKEIGTIRAIGTTKFQTLRLFILESICISLMGIAIGWLFGFGLSFYFSQVGIPFGESVGVTSNIPMGDRIYTTIEIWEYAGTLLLGFFAGIVGGIVPAIRATQLKVVDALRD